MADTVFKSLCRQARDAGSKRLRFEVDLDAFLSIDDAGAGPEGSWLVFSPKEGYENVARSYARGRTGEEALRRLVGALTAPEKR